MKTLLLTTFAFILFFTTFAAPKRYKLLNSTANWANVSNWAPAGLPSDGDTIYVPENIQLILSNDLTLKNVYFDLYGSLVLSGLNMKLILQNLSTLNVHTSGWIDGDKASQQIVLDGIIFKGNQPILIGPKIATSSSSGFITYFEPSILPVMFQTFTVIHNKSDYLVQWSATEVNSNGYYEVQRSYNGTSWSSIAIAFMAGSATSNYNYTDKEETGNTVYYRIKQIDADGTANYTQVRTLKNTTAVIPDITAIQNKIIVAFPQPVNGKVVIEVISINGVVLMKQTVTDPTGNVQFTINNHKGVFIVHVSNGNDLNIAKQIIL